MQFPNYLTWLFRLCGRRNSRVAKQQAVPIQSVDQFRIALERERNRANRAGSRFALVAFTLRASGECADRQEQLISLSSRLKLRLRSIDEVGWLDEHRIGALLFGATREAACTVATNICRSLPAEHVPHWEVDTYPDQDSEAPSGERTPERPSIDLPLPALAPVAVSSALCVSDLFAKPMSWPKRVVDIAGAAFGLTIAAPILLMAAVSIRLTSPGPIFFTQWRAGRGGKPFRMYKLRSMVVDAEARRAELIELNEQDGPAFKIKNDPRVTGVGRIIRKLSIDELPQLWNVLWGDMSLVGPRPLPCPEIQSAADWHKTRLDVTPGLTCFWQVQGRSQVSFDEWMRLDSRYIKQQSLSTDLRLIAQTIPAVFRGEGV